MKSVLASVLHLFIGVVLFAISASSYAGTGTQSKSTPTIEDVLVASGMKVGLDKFPSNVAGPMFANFPQSISDETKKEIAAGYEAAFPMGSITNAALAAAKSNTRLAARIPHLMEAVTSPLAMKMTAMELKVESPQEIQKFMATLSSKPPSSGRVALLKEILTEGRGLDVANAITGETAESIAVALSTGCPDEIRRIRQELTKNRLAIREATYSTMLLGLLFTYRTATDEELAQYLATYKDPDAQLLHTIVGKAIVREYLDRWKIFEKTLFRLGDDLSGRSMFAKSCRMGNKMATESADLRTSEGSNVVAQPKRVSRASEDARQCLRFESSRQIAVCAEKFR